MALGLLSSANILPGESRVMPISWAAAADVFCWYGCVNGENWEVNWGIISMYYHDVKWTVWAGQTTEFTPKAEG
jgi:hypothetical protein